MYSPEYKNVISRLFSEAVMLEHKAFYFYLSAGAAFNGKCMAMENLSEFFYRESSEELEHARELIAFMNQNGFTIDFFDIKIDQLSDQMNSSKCPIVLIFTKAVELEQAVLDNFIKIYRYADGYKDYRVTQFVDKFLQRQVEEVKSFSDRLRNAERTTGKLGEFLYDQSFKSSK